MNREIYASIRRNPKFHELIRRRSRLAGTLATIVLVVFYGLILVVAFNPALIGERVYQGSMLTIGVAAGLFIFVTFWLLTALYVYRASNEFDATTKAIVDAAKSEHM